MDSSERYEQARQLIRGNRLEEARSLLLPIQHEARAADWIGKLDAHLVGTSVALHPGRKSRKLSRWIIGVATLFAVLTFLLGLVIGGYALDLKPEATPDRIQSFVVVTATPLPATETLTPTITPIPTRTSIPTWTPIPPDRPAVSVGTNDTDSGKWYFHSDISALDDSSTYAIMLDAENSIQAWLTNPTPTLIIRCRNRQYDVYITADTQLDSTLDSDVYTRVRYGDNPPTNVTMGESTTGDSMFFPSAVGAIRNLLTVNRLVVGFTPFNANSVEAIFDITSLETAIQPLFDACGRP